MLDRALQLAQAAARRAGLQYGDPEIIRVSSAVLVALPGTDVVARVEDDIEAAWRQWRVGRFFNARGAPTMRLQFPDLEPFCTDDGAVTLWQYLPQGPPISKFELGRLLRVLHDCARISATDAAAAGLPTLSPIGRIEYYLARLPDWVDDHSRTALRARTDELTECWQRERERDPLGAVITHGDVHLDNVMVGAQGPVFVDLEAAGLGPASWDFAPLAVHVRLYDQSMNGYRSFLDGYFGRPDEKRDYGADEWPDTWPGFEYLCQIYELVCAVWAMGYSRHAPEHRREAEVRLDTMLGREHGHWTLT